jgi:hypothetical protein
LARNRDFQHESHLRPANYVNDDPQVGAVPELNAKFTGAVPIGASDFLIV